MRESTIVSPFPPSIRVESCLLLALMVPVGLAHASAVVERSQTPVQPSWISQLTLDGTMHEGVLGTANDVDYYRIAVTELAEVVIDSQSELDIHGVLLDSLGRRIATGGEGRAFRIGAVLNSGDYYLQISQYSIRAGTSDGGKYALQATGTILSPVPLLLDGSSTEGALAPGESADYFRIEVTELTDVVLYTSGGTDTIGAVLDSEGREIVSNDDGGEERNFRVTPLLWPGEYILRVTPWVSSSGHSETGSYSLHAQGTPAAIAQLPLDGSSKEGVIEPGENADYFRIEVTELTDAVFYTSGGTDTVGALLDSEGREIFTNDDGGIGSNFRLTAILRAGEYYVSVARWQRRPFPSDPVAPVPVAAPEAAASGPGSYILHADGASLSPTPVALDGTPREGFIDSGNSADYFRFEVTELTEAAIYTSGGLDTVGALLDVEGREIMSDDDSGSSGNFRIATLLWPGEYFVRVTPWIKFSGQFDTGSYSLHAEGQASTPVHLTLNGPPRHDVIETAEDEDYFRIETSEPTAAVFYTTGSLDTAGALLGAKGDGFAFNDDGGEQFINFRIAVIIWQPDEYFLRVSSSSGLTGSYTLHTEGISAGP